MVITGTYESYPEPVQLHVCLYILVCKETRQRASNPLELNGYEFTYGCWKHFNLSGFSFLIWKKDRW